VLNTNNVSSIIPGELTGALRSGGPEHTPMF